MTTYISLLRTITFFFSRILHKQYLRSPRYLHRKVNNTLITTSYSKLPPNKHTFPSDDHYEEVDRTLIFNVEETLLKSSSLFPYFMLVAFEAGSPLRAVIFLVLYPFMCLFGQQMRLKMMVMVCFLGIRKKGFNIIGRGVLPKVLLENVGLQGFEMVNKCKRKIGVSELPQVMVDSFLRDYLQVDFVVGKELKDYCGYFVGLMHDNQNGVVQIKNILEESNLKCTSDNNVIVGISGNPTSLSHPLFSFCKEIYPTNETMKKKWQNLAKSNYPQPLIFHDGRLAIQPTLLSTLALFIWFPFGFFLAIFRAIICLTLPHKISNIVIAFVGLRIISSTDNSTKSSPTPSSSNGGDQIKPKSSQLYVCNHRTLLDPLYLSHALNKPLTAVTYSLSRMSEILAPIRTVRLSRDRDRDGMMMKKLLNQGDLVICPEGTTCREPFLLRFSPLFGEISENIIPVALNTHVTMFYGTTASGLKCLDPLFFLMNPRPSYTVRLLDRVDGLSTCHDQSRSRFYVANHVQREIGDVLNFKCTTLTRKDKYLVLAGNQGVV